MILKLIDFHLHRLAGLSNIINFSNVNLYNFQTFDLINLHLGVFGLVLCILSFLNILIKLAQQFVQQVRKIVFGFNF